MEFDVIKQLKSYWDKIVGLTDKDKEDEEKFIDATSEHSVRTSKFLEGLNLDPIMSELNKHYSVPEGEEDYDHNIPLAKQVCRGTEDDNQYLEGMLKKTAVSAKENMDETWFDGGYNSNQNIALAHVEFGLTCHNLSSVVYLT